MNQNIILRVTITFLFLISFIKANDVDMFVHHFNKQTFVMQQKTSWFLKESGTFYPRLDPISPDYSVVSPMVKVVGSNTLFDGENHEIFNGDSIHQGQVGIEVGYSQAELTADPTLKQPHNITIRNLRLSNFDCAVIVHKGVKNITIENCSFVDCSCGIVMMGTSGNILGNRVVHVTIKNCNVIGHGQDKHAALVALKALIETTYGYGVDSFIPLRKDVLNSDTVDVYSYVGLYATYVRYLMIDNFRVEGIGYQDYDSISEGNGKRTEAVGAILKNSGELDINNVCLYGMSSELKSVGLQLEQVDSICLDSVQCCHNISAQKAIGFEVLNDQGVDYSLQVASFKNICSSQHYSPEIVVGLDLTDTRDIFLEFVKSFKNNGEKSTYGLRSYKISYSNFCNSIFSNNISDRAINDVATNDGILSCGVYIENGMSLEFEHVKCNNNRGENSGRGMHFKNSKKIRLCHIHCISNESVQKRSGEDAAIRAAQDVSEISKYGPTVDEAITGGYGCILEACERFDFGDSKSDMNYGHRTAGYVCKDCDLLSFQNCTALYQSSSGNFLHDDIALTSQGGIIADRTTASVMSSQTPLLFSDATINSNILAAIDVEKLVFDMLNTMKDIRKELDQGSEVTYSLQEALIDEMSLLDGFIARFRVWGTAFGLHFHNCKSSVVSKCEMSGQSSDKDSAVGIMATGRNKGLVIQECDLSYNHAWKDSKRTLAASSANYIASYDLTAVKKFWDMVLLSFTSAADSDSVGFNTALSKFIAQGQKKLDDTGDAISVEVSSGQNQSFINVIAPTASGLVLGDLCFGGFISNNKCQANNAESGHAHGIAVHLGHGLSIKENVISDNGSNIYGYCSGLIDISPHSSNTYLENEFSFNKLADSYNSNIAVIFDPKDKNSLVFPKTVFKNGELKQKRTEKDNVEINLKKTNESYEIESDDDKPHHEKMKEKWKDKSWIK